MLRGENMRFRPAIFIWFVFAQSFFKFHKNDDNQKLKAWSIHLRKNISVDCIIIALEHCKVRLPFFLYALYIHIAHKNRTGLISSMEKLKYLAWFSSLYQQWKLYTVTTIYTNVTDIVHAAWLDTLHGMVEYTAWLDRLHGQTHCMVRLITWLNTLHG